MSRHYYKGIGLALLLSALWAGPGCNKATSGGEGPPPSPPAKLSDNTAKSGASPMTHASSPAATILGFRLGAPYPDALATAKKDFQMRDGAAEAHSGEGAIDGIPVTLDLRGKGGVLIDVKVHAQLAQADADLGSSVLFTKLQAELGKPADLGDDLATWSGPGYQVQLQRLSSWAKGEAAPRIEYALRGKVTQSAPAPTGDAERDAKERELREAAEKAR